MSRKTALQSVAAVAAAIVIFLMGYWFPRGGVAEPESYVLVNGQIVRVDARGAKTPIGPPITGAKEDSENADGSDDTEASADDAKEDETADADPDEKDEAPPAPAPATRTARPAPSPPARAAAPAPNTAPNTTPRTAPVLAGAPAAGSTPPDRVAKLDPKLAAPSPRPADYRTFQNRDLDGGDINTLKQVDLARCVSECRGNASCRAYSYDKWNRYCFLKSEIGVLRLDPRSVSGVLEKAPAPRSSTTVFSMERYRGKAFTGTGYKTIKSQPDQCEPACKNEQACVAFTFHKREGLCHLFDQVGEYFSNSFADSGGKIQKP